MCPPMDSAGRDASTLSAHCSRPAPFSTSRVFPDTNLATPTPTVRRAGIPKTVPKTARRARVEQVRREPPPARRQSRLSANSASTPLSASASRRCWPDVYRSMATQQYAFSVGEDGQTDGGIESTEESVETSLETFVQRLTTANATPASIGSRRARFGVDDRPSPVTSTEAGEQGTLFADTDDDQRMLTGERAADCCLFETDASSGQSHRER